MLSLEQHINHPFKRPLPCQNQSQPKEIQSQAKESLLYQVKINDCQIDPFPSIGLKLVLFECASQPVFETVKDVSFTMVREKNVHS